MLASTRRCIRPAGVSAVALSMLALWMVAAVGLAIYETHQTGYRIRGTWHNAWHSWMMTISSDTIQIEASDETMNLSYKVVGEEDDKINVTILSGPTKWEGPKSIEYHSHNDSI